MAQGHAAMMYFNPERKHAFAIYQDRVYHIHAPRWVFFWFLYKFIYIYIKLGKLYNIFLGLFLLESILSRKKLRFSSPNLNMPILGCSSCIPKSVLQPGIINWMDNSQVCNSTYTNSQLFGVHSAGQLIN